MCFFAKTRLCKKLFKIARSKFLNTEVKGVPSDVYRSSVNLIESKENYANSSACSFCIYLKNDNLSFDFSFIYVTKTKTAYVTSYFFNFDLTFSPEGIEMIKSKYNMFNFEFANFIKVSFPGRVCETEDEAHAYIDDFIRTWNENELYELLVELKKTLKN